MIESRFVSDIVNPGSADPGDGATHVEFPDQGGKADQDGARHSMEAEPDQVMRVERITFRDMVETRERP